MMFAAITPALIAGAFAERKRLMAGHARVGRTYSGRVLQLITGSTGIDDWEWGVTLFAVRPDDLKEVVHTMRFDEASARFGEFGPFYTGMVAEPAEGWTVAGGKATITIPMDSVRVLKMQVAPR